MSARARWAVPVGAAAAVGIVIGATAVASAAVPSLPAQSVAQLLVDVQQGTSKPLGPLTATVQETASLGLPALPQIGAITGQPGQFGALNPLAGTTTVSVWYLDPQHVRIAEQVQMGESDLRLDGRQLWLWNSKSQTATHVLLPAQAGNEHAPAASSSGSATFNYSAGSPSPLAAAREALAAIGPSTTVRLGPNVTVAGRPAYQISIAPKAGGSLIGQVLIAIDASRHVPLRVQVFARGSSSPAFQIGYTALTFGRPAMSNFAFTPPAGAQVKTITLPAKTPAGLAKGGLAGLGLAGLGPLGLLGGPAARFGSSCSAKLTQTCVPAPAIPPAARQAILKRLSATLPKNLTPAQRAAALKALQKSFAAGQHGTIGALPLNPGGPMIPARLPRATLEQLRNQFIARLPKNLTPAQRAAAISAFDKRFAAAMKASQSPGPTTARIGSPRVIGKDWTSVFVTPANPAVAAAVQQLLSGKPGALSSGWTAYSPLGGSGKHVVSAPAGIGNGPAGVPIGPDLMILRALLRASTAVHGAWGSGRLLQTTLLTVLVTSKGQILAGAVTPSVLYADAASLSR